MCGRIYVSSSVYTYMYVCVFESPVSNLCQTNNVNLLDASVNERRIKHISF